MEFRFECIFEKKLIGLKLNMSLSSNRTFELWQKFMLRRNEIQNQVNSSLYSLQNYPPNYFSNFSPDNKFDKWALAEVENFDFVPNGMFTFNLPAGNY
ncbi:MAG: GyrI-like domain-containing protein, partial [Daejeonella sp.]